MLTYASGYSGRRFALLGRCVLSLVTLVSFVGVFSAYNYGRTSVVELQWYTVGAFSLGAFPVFLFVRHRITLPVVVTTGLYVVSLVTMWTRITSAYEEGATLHAGPAAVAFLLTFWVVPFASIGLVGGSEYVFKHLLYRRRVRRSSGE